MLTCERTGVSKEKTRNMSTRDRRKKRAGMAWSALIWNPLASHWIPQTMTASLTRHPDCGGIGIFFFCTARLNSRVGS